jgi:chorismate-pyruvate lyase
MSFEVDLGSLLDEFYGDFSGNVAEENRGSHLQLGTFIPVGDVPGAYDNLLNHHHHMTVTIEAFYKEKVDVSVHRHRQGGDYYSREITLVTEHSKRIVQHGIVRIDISALAEPVWKRIESGETPLGRVLIENEVLRDVEMQQLWEIKAGPCLAEKLHSVIGETFYGRTAMIHCDGKPAIELLEIVSRV